MIRVLSHTRTHTSSLSDLSTQSTSFSAKHCYERCAATIGSFRAYMTSMSDSAIVPLSAPPKESQLVEHDGKTYKTIREGLAYILVPPDVKISQDPQSKKSKADVEEDAPKAQNVFYNPIQQFNRDLSVLAIKAFGEDLCERRKVKWEKSRERFAIKKGKQRDRKRKRQEQEIDDTAETQNAAIGAQADLVVKALSVEAEQGQDVSMADVDAVPAVEIITLEQDQEQIDAAPTAKATTLEQEEEKIDAAPAAEATILEQEEEKKSNQKSHTQPFRILDALSATGLRALRYAQEIPFATSITANDLDRKAVKSIEMHLQHNNLTDKIHPITSNAIAHMYSVAYPPSSTHGPSHVSAKYDVIDLDPYGTAGPFIDAALQALNDGGLLCVTCTDSGVFASCGYSEKTFSLYGGLPVKGNHSHEAGLRLIAQSIASAGAKHGISIEPLLSLSIDFYARLFIRIRRSPADVKFLAGKTMIVYECDSGCGAWTTQLLGRNTRQGETTNYKHGMSQGPTANRSCEHCGSRTHIAGPMWAGPLHHQGFIQKILDDVKTVDRNIYGTTTRIEGMLDTALDELLDSEYVREPTAPGSKIPRLAPQSLDRQPFFFLPSNAARAMHCQAPPEAAIKGALRHAGYRATRSHCKPGSIKTNASWSAIWHIFREWVKQKAPVKMENIREGSSGWILLRLGSSNAAGPNVDISEEEKFKVVFDEALGRDKTGKKFVRYQTNPRENWGPMSRAKGAP